LPAKNGQGEKKMIDSTRKINTLVLLLLLTTSFVFLSANLGKAEPFESSETIVITMNPVSSNALVKNVEINSSNTIDLPINYSVEAFNDHFKSAKYVLVREGKNFVAYLIVTYTTMDAGKAENYTDDILSQFLGLFNLNLSVIDKDHTFDNATSSIIVSRKLGYIEYQVEPVEEFLKYKGNGFGGLISDEFLSIYVPGDSYTGCSIEYILESVDGAFSWRFSSLFSQRVAYSLDEGHVDINLNETFHAAIKPSVESSKIFIEFYEDKATEVGTYAMSLLSTTPNYTAISEEEGVVTVTYDWTSINSTNLVLQIGVQKNTSDDNIVKLAVIAVAVSILSITIFVVAKKRKRNSHSYSNYCNKNER
jgi:hypothetical protein